MRTMSSKPYLHLISFGSRRCRECAMPDSHLAPSIEVAYAMFDQSPTGPFRADGEDQPRMPKTNMPMQIPPSVAVSRITSQS